MSHWEPSSGDHFFDRLCPYQHIISQNLHPQLLGIGVGVVVTGQKGGGKNQCSSSKKWILTAGVFERGGCERSSLSGKNVSVCSHHQRGLLANINILNSRIKPYKIDSTKLQLAKMLSFNYVYACKLGLSEKCGFNPFKNKLKLIQHKMLDLKSTRC